MAQIITDGHAHTKDHTGGITLEHGFHISLRLGVEALVEVGFVFFGEANARPEGVSVVIFEDAPSGVDGAVDVAFIAQVGNVECANDVGTDSLGFVIFAPINVGTAGNAGGVEDVGGLDRVELGGHVGAVLDACRGKDDLDILFTEEGGHFTADPAGFAAVDESFGDGSRHGDGVDGCY